jgi:N-acetylglucosamine kinase-like BadF-type ATPase
MSEHQMPDTQPRYYLGVDTGATKSHALIIDNNGRISGFGTAGPGNWESVGWQGTRQILTDIISQATAQAKISCSQIAGAGFGLAGYDWPEDHQPHIDIIRDIGIVAPVQLMNDAFIGLPAGTDAGWGVVVSAGTSCNCYGRNPQGKIGRVVGSSSFGEYAGAGELVWRALQAVAHAWTQRGKPTQLADVFLAATGAHDVPDLLAGLMRNRYWLGAKDAALVFEAANDGDGVAVELIWWAGSELGELAKAVIQQLAIAELAFDVVLSGSFYHGSPVIQEVMSESIQQLAPQVQLVHLSAPPVVGAALLGAELDGLETAILRPILLKNIQSVDI